MLFHRVYKSRDASPRAPRPCGRLVSVCDKLEKCNPLEYTSSDSSGLSLDRVRQACAGVGLGQQSCNIHIHHKQISPELDYASPEYVT